MTKAARGRPAKALSKSKLLAFRQCEKRLWLEVHRPELRTDSAATQASFQVGQAVGDMARRLYDPAGVGVLLDAHLDGYEPTLQTSLELLASNAPVFEAGYTAGGVLAFADVMLPVKCRGKNRWRMVEVKSSTNVKDYHRDDVAIQAFVARKAGVALESIALACIDSQWTYPGKGNYVGLFKEEDLTGEAFAREHEVQEWIAQAQAVLRSAKEPARVTGGHCSDPYECGFMPYCRAQEPRAKFPVAWLPRVQAKALKTHLFQAEVIDLRQVPDVLLNPTQLRVKSQSLSGMAWFDSAGAAKALKAHRLPAYFLDFETIQFPVPVWAGTRPYAQIPFQFSLHKLSKAGALKHRQFLDLSGDDPSKAFAEALIAECGPSGPIFVYNAGFEKARIKEAAARFRLLRARLLALIDRVVDLLPVAQAHFYHPSQEGSWSIKKVLPSLVPELRYDQLDGVQDGCAAMEAYLEAVAPETSAQRKSEIERQLLAYCSLDTYAMVRLWQVFAGRESMKL